MTRRNTWAGLVAVIALSLSLTACKDTKTLQENEQLKSQVADLQKQNTQMNSDLQSATAARDELARENESLKAEVKPKKSKHSAKKTSRKKRRRS
jgi:FtsZ-binding cell division protein ZapB